MKKIRLHPHLMNQISTELGVTIQTVRMSLYYVFNSETSVKIRLRAKELLKKESDEITEKLNEQA